MNKILNFENRLVILLAVVLGAAIVVFVAITKNRIHDGIVVEKIHEPAQTHTYVTYMRVGKMYLPQIHVIHDDEDWILAVRGVSDNGNDTIIQNFYVDEADWNCIGVGEYFNDSIICGKYTDDGN